jgi:hypothetical protein
MSYFGKRKIVSVGLIHCNSGRTNNLGTAWTLRIVGVSLCKRYLDEKLEPTFETFRLG